MNSAEPVTLVRSPTLTNSESSRDVQRFQSGQSQRVIVLGGIVRGGNFATASAMALMCAGVVPQQPPMMLRKPDCAHSAISLGHGLGRFVVFAELVRQAGVRMCAHVAVGEAGQFLDVLAQLLGAERAVEAETDTGRAWRMEL